MWIISFIISSAIFIYGVAYSIYRTKNESESAALKPLHALVISVFSSSFFVFLPVYLKIFYGDTFRIIKSVLLSIHNTIRLFIVDGEFTIITDNISTINGWIYTPYSVLAAILFVIAPILTFGAVLLLFKNLSAFNKYLLGYNKDTYIFSDLNEYSVSLARSLKNNHRNIQIVFTNVIFEKEEKDNKFVEEANKLNAILMRKDIQSVNFSKHNKNSTISFLMIDASESLNINQAYELIKIYKNRNNTDLYVFAISVESELLLSSVDKGQIKLRRINSVKNEINQLLYTKGTALFENAVCKPDGIKNISAIIIGMGQHGNTMVRSLSWYCQMDGYRLKINAFDKDNRVAELFEINYPELLNTNNDNVRLEDFRYEINIHSGINYRSKEFIEKIKMIDDITYVFISLGSDEENLSAATYLRMIFERFGKKPIIQAIVKNSNMKRALTGITNYRNQPYNIEFVGDTETLFSEEIIFNSSLENEALKSHLKWGEEEEFWKYEYNYRSSIATTIHRRARIFCGIQGADKPENELTENERNIIERLEHRRWNTYMRSEGYVYAARRNDLAKEHNNLVGFDLLTEEDKRKDSRVGNI